MKGDEVAFTVIGTGLSTTSQLIRVIGSGAACSSHVTGDILQDAGVANGAQKFMTSPNAATTSATVTFTLNTAAAGAKFCLLAPKTQLGTGGYADTGSGSVLTVTVLEITAIISSVEVAGQSPTGTVKWVPDNLAQTLTLKTAAQTLNTADKVKVVANSHTCNEASDSDGTAESNKVTGGGGLAIATVSSTSASVSSNFASKLNGGTGATSAAGVEIVKICVKLGTATSYQSYHDTGMTLKIGKPSITAVDLDRQMKGDQVLFTFTGLFFTTAHKVKVIGAADTCSGGSAADAADIITGGNVQSLGSISGATSGATTATATFTLNEAVTSAKFCFYSTIATGSDASSWAAPTNANTITVIKVTAIASSVEVAGQSVGTIKYVPDSVAGTLTLTTAAQTLNTADKIKVVANSHTCDEASDSTGTAESNMVTGGSGLSIASVTSASSSVSASFTNLNGGTGATNAGDTETVKVCVKLGTAASFQQYHDTGMTLKIGKPGITAVSFVRLGDDVTFTFTGRFLVASAQKVKAVALAATCAGTSPANDADDIITGGGVQPLGDISGAASGATTATATFTLGEVIAAAKWCFYSTIAGGSDASSWAAVASTQICIPGVYNYISCFSCKPGTHTAANHQTSCVGTECAKGKYGPAAQTSAATATCTDCVAGRFTDATGQVSCLDSACGAGQFGPAAQTSAPKATCTNCGAGQFTSVTGTVACGDKAIKKCVAGEAYTEGTLTADDSSCASCVAGRWNNLYDTSACAAKTVLKCVAGEGYTEGSTTADDSKCDTCIAKTWNNAEDTSGCVAKTVLKCVEGQGYSEGITTADSSTCATCAAGKWNNADDDSACASKTIQKCVAGEAYTEGTLTADDSSCASCVAGRWNNLYDTSACAAKTVLKCAQGKGYSEGTTIADNSACATCPTGTYSDTDDTSACKTKTPAACATGKGYTEGSSTSVSSRRSGERGRVVVRTGGRNEGERDVRERSVKE
jgi:hypothetical protein